MSPDDIVAHLRKCSVHRKVVAAVEELAAGFKSLLEVAEDMRDYTHDWDWKYGEYWDAELKKARETKAK